MTRVADGVALDNLTLTLGQVRYVVPRAEIHGTSLSVTDVQALFDSESGVPLRDRLVRLSAAEIVAPKVLAEVTVGGVRQITTYRDVVVSDVKEGHIAALRAGGGAFETSGDPKAGHGTFARLGIEDLDLGLALALYAGTGRPEPEPMRRLYGGISIEGLAIADAAGTTTRIARMAGGEVLVRASREGLASSAALFDPANADLSRADRAERRRVLAAAANLLDSFEVRSIELTGFEVSDPRNVGGSGRVARIAYRAAVPDRAAEIRLEGLDSGAEGGRLRIGAVAIGGLSLRPLLEVAGELAERQGRRGAADASQVRNLIPGSGTLRVSDLAFEPSPGAAGSTGAAGFSIGSIEVSADKPVERLPSELRIALRDVTVPISRDAEGERDLADLGYTRISASFGFAAGWDQAAREVVLRDLSVRSPELGSVAISGRLGNVTRDVFDRDSAVALVALVGATATSLDITLDNAGLFERIVARQAAREGRSAEDVRREWGLAASFGVPALLGGSSASKALGAALARFVAKPGHLALQVKARDPAGLSLADLTGSPDPTALLDRVDITAASR